MADKQEMQAMPHDHDGAHDGVGDAPGKTAGGSESSGGAYPNPHTGKDERGDEGGVGGGFLEHGGQSEVAYSGTGDRDTDDDVGNANAVTKE